MCKKVKMITKGLDLGGLTNHANRFVHFYSHLAELKNLLRQGLVRRHGLKKEKAESVGDHIFSTTMMALLIVMELRCDLDAVRIVLMLLVHDIVEAIAGDVIPTDNMMSEEKISHERKALYEIFSQFESGQFFIDLWEEYVAQETPEAQFARDFDLLDAVLMATMYDKNGLNEGSRQAFWDDASEKIKTPEARAILNSLK